ncbi:hypothetical protein JOD55_000665 [Arcanobacterium pluranimalium]|uniref:hypothetical protein n=1 Tax=Arcanobacterium pluranimalium TaxID=108028 RepID=UPI00195AE2D8|nr:hypothetical protein [Arcanobacterium pluranimalium]MBM7824838.1 hypothetical protein [Arcanobacterium pluranimalium]
MNGTNYSSTAPHPSFRQASLQAQASTPAYVSSKEGWLYLIYACLIAFHYVIMLQRTNIPWGGILTTCSSIIFLFGGAALSANIIRSKRVQPLGFRRRKFFAFAFPIGVALFGLLLEVLGKTPHFTWPATLLIATITVVPMTRLGVFMIRLAHR